MINQFYGPIPSELGLLNFEDLDISTNSLTGNIPSEFGRMTDILSLGLRENNLNGTIPTQLGQLAAMDVLAFYRNNLSGPLPSQLAALTNMTIFYTYENTLTGAIPSEFGLLTSMQNFWLHNNSLSGSVPNECGSMTNLVNLRLENNAFTGTIPESLCSLGLFDPDIGIGLSFNCSEQLCGCCWCSCSDSNYSANCDPRPFVPSRDDSDWHGQFPTPVNSFNVITINIRTDQYPDEVEMKWSHSDDFDGWKLLKSWIPEDAHSIFSETIDIESDGLYKLQISDGYGDGICCTYGMGWFSITNSTPSSDHLNGTVVWDVAGYQFEESLEVFIWIDQDGNAQHLENPTNRF